MLYIVIALKSEAQAFVEKFKLTKERCENFTLYKNEKMTIIITGVGVQNSKHATSWLIEKFSIGQKDRIINIGICGAKSSYKIGELIKVDVICYKNQKVTINKDGQNIITCLDFEADGGEYEIVDMESFGFFEATNGVENRSISKVVSDHFEPQKVTKDGVKNLILKNLEEIISNEKSCSNWC